jgi:hypothetical protein
MLLAACAGSPQLDTVTESAAFNGAQTAWIRCTLTETERLLGADRSPHTIAIAANAACERYPTEMRLMFLRAGITAPRFSPLMDSLERKSHTLALRHVLEKRARISGPSD